ncbi:uncharacterized protein LOC106663315 [Cimex lectularius]|uniref:DUF6443 domain-containing protein n=1 Tax=Cimex lectularius TaxID=79782 RepID=A0A8I6RCW7_CIMLE|nr:uncharacterized protein LOC106663315 [Cimex lectularius]
MEFFYRLKKQEKRLPFGRDVRIYEEPEGYFFFQDDMLYLYNRDNLSPKLEKNIVADEIYFFNEFIAVRSVSDIFQYDKNGLSLVSMSDDYDGDILEGGRKIIKIGRFFKHNHIGLLVCEDKFEFYEFINGDFFQRTLPKHAANVLNSKVCGSEIMVQNLRANSSDHVVIKGEKTITLLSFDDSANILEFVLDENLRSERVHFANLSGKEMKDMIFFTKAGLLVYSYDRKTNNYALAYHYRSFSSYRKYADSVKFVDIDLDGVDEMVANSPWGLTIHVHNKYRKKFKNVLEVMPLSSRYDKLIHATSKFVFTESESGLNVFEIVKSKIEEKRELEIKGPASSIKSMLPKVKMGVEKDELLLQNTLDYSQVLTSVDASGKVKFTLPLFSLEKSLDFVINYVGTNAQSDIIGVGWFLTEDKIVRMHASSIYQEDERYFLVLKSIPIPIQIKNSTFVLNGTDYKLNYFPEKEHFELEAGEMRLLYGIVDNKADGVEYELKWHDWNGPGGDSDGQVAFPRAWYLKRLVMESYAINFNYKKIDVRTPNGMSYTREMYLSEVYDHRNKIQFFYGEKFQEEYKLPPMIDEETSNYNMDTVKTKYLSGYRLETSNYVQNVDFIYSLINGKRFLKNIAQKGIVFMNFSYEDDVLVGVNFPPTNVSLNYIYELGIDVNKTYIKKIETENYDNYKIDFLNRLIIVSYTHQNKTIIEINDNEMGELEKFTLNNGNKLVKFLNVRHMICALFNSGEIHVVHQEKNKFYDKGSFNFTVGAIFKPSGSFLMYKDKTVGVIEYDDEKGEYTRKDLFPENNLVATAFNRFVAVYDNVNIMLAYKTADHWHTKILKNIPGFIDQLNNTLNLFDFTDNFKNDMYTMFSELLIQIFNNMLMINTVKYENLQFETRINVFLLNQTYDIVKEKEIVKKQDDVTSLVKDSHLKNSIYEVVYEPSGDKLKKKVIGFKGEIKEKFDEAKQFVFNEIKEHERKVRRHIEMIRSEQKAIVMEKAKPYYEKAGETYKHLVDEKVDIEFKSLNDALNQELESALNNLKQARRDTVEEFEKYKIEICQNITQALPRDYALLDRDKYSFYLLNGKITNDKTQYIYTGQDFIEKEMTVAIGNDIKLDQGYSLKKDVTYKIVKDYEEIDLEVGELYEIRNGFPFYIASIKPNGLKVIEFHKYTEPEMNEIDEEMFASGFAGLATRNGSTVSVRPQLLRYAFPDRRVKRIELTFDGRKIASGFEYKSPKVLNELYYEVHSVIQGDDKKYGRVEFRNGTKRIFDGDGVLLKTISKVEQKEKVDKRERNLFFDKTGLFVISDFTPYDSKNDEVYYYGFENYEENKKFTFNNNDVVKGFSLTGKNYLKVKSSFQGTFVPKEQNGIYKVSCWLRTAKRLTIGEKTVLVKVIVEEDGKVVLGVLGEILFKMRDWLYVEAVVNLSDAREITNELTGFSDKLSIRVNISNCDLDNVLFAPNVLKTSINVFDEEGNVSEVIVNGLIKRQIYKMNKKVASIDEYGKLELFVSRGKNSNLEIIPANGYYENFSLFSFGTNLIADDDNWAVSPGVLRHEGEDSVLKITSESHCLSFDYSLKQKAEIVIGDLIIKENSIMFNDESKDSYAKGEIILIRIKDRCFVWLDGSIIFEKTAVFNLEMKFKGDAYIKNLFVFEDPSVKMEYFNGLKDKVQEIRLIDEKTALVQEFLYDELGRQDIQTRPILLKGNVFDYHRNFVMNKNPDAEDSVWRTGRIKGEAGEYSYTRLEYEENPLNRILTVDVDPGVDQAFDSFFKRYRYNETYPLLRNVFPKDFYFVTEEKRGGVEKTKVYDSSDNWRGTYIKVANGRGLLSTFDYNGTNLVRILPPLYHDKVGTLRKFDNRETVREKILKKIIGVNCKYDDKDRMVEITTPDSGKTQYIYEGDFLKFVIYEDSVTFFEYEGEWLTKTGVLKNKNLNSEKIVYQSFIPGDGKNPAIRGSVFRTITYDKLTAIEETVEHNKMRMKRIILPDGHTMELKKTIHNIYKEEVEYPAFVNNKRFKIFYKYNRLGKLTNVYSNDGLVDIVYKYNGLKLAQESKGKSFRRSYIYDAPGFLTKITDAFLTEEISFSLGSYGGISFGDGTIVRTTFKAHWYDFSPPDNTDCFKRLKERNYLDGKGHLIKDFYPYLEPDIVNCTSLYEKHFPSRYGHAYTYGKYQQLIKAKFFVEEVPPILQPASFARVPGLNSTASKAIWKSLKDSGFIIADKEFLDEHLVHSKKGRSIINPLIFRELERNDLERYKLVENVLLGFFKDEYLENILGKKTVSILNKKGYIKDPYSEDFKATLKNYKDQLRHITDILRRSFATELGTSQYDVDHFEIDPNGNLLKYYNGLNKYDLIYRENTNLIDYIKINEVKYNLKHDKRGNVIRADHRDIEKVVYNQVINRVNEIRLKCGKVIHYSYDSSGERIYKMVQQDGKIIKEVFYVRDEAGRTAVEKEIRHEEEPDVMVTLYVYGPTGLTGFVRRNKFYNVLTDHEGSVRLVVRDGEVVAAYDYLPYGELMRKKILDSDADLAYRFTGQEYDEETGLYNYHARLYDPSLGRFYQIDPMGQYFSPYLYAGNSPLTLVDPDGEFVFISILVVTGISSLIAYSYWKNGWDMEGWKETLKETWNKINYGLEVVKTFVKFGTAAVILKGLGVPIAIAGIALLALAGLSTIQKFRKSNSKFDPTSLTTWCSIFEAFVESISEISEIVLDVAEFIGKIKDKYLKKKATKKNKITQRGSSLGDNPADKKIPPTYNKRAKNIIRNQQLMGQSKAKKLSSKRQKRSTEEGIINVSCNNITLIRMKDVDSIVYLSDGHESNTDLNIWLEKCLATLDKVVSEKNAVTVKQIKNTLSHVIIDKARNFESTDFKGFLIDDENYRAYVAMAVEILRAIPDDTETLRNIKENAAVFLKEIWDDYDLTDGIGKIRNLQADPIQWKIVSDDNLLVTSYKEPCTDVKCPMASTDWICEDETPAWDPSFPELNSTLLLTDVLLAKKGKRRLQRAKRQTGMKWSETMAYTLSIIDAFENFLNEISGEETSLYQMTGKIRNKISNSRFDEITPLLDDYVKNSSIDFHVYQREKFNLEQRIHEILFQNEINVLNDTRILTDHANSTAILSKSMANNNPTIRLLSHERN